MGGGVPAYKIQDGSKRKKKSRSKNGLLHTLWHLPWPFTLALLVGVLLATNWVYQVCRKPSELIGVLDDSFHKSPEETWTSYGDVFRKKSTSIMTPDLLAALAQMESNGNPIVRTYWKWRWTSDLGRVFAPASSAVGMFQITEGTFEEARRFCVRSGQAYRDSENGAACWGSFAYSRLIPSHAIEMTSARLDYYVHRTLAETGRRNASLREKQALAIVIHLCGAGRGERFARLRFNARRLGACGDHNPATYVSRVRRLQDRFRRYLHKENVETIMASSN